MLKEIWVIGDLRNDRLLGFSLNVLAKARDLAGAVDGRAAMVLFDGEKGAHKGDSGPVSLMRVADAEKVCLSCGADQVYILENKRFYDLRSDRCAGSLAGVVQQYAPMLVLSALTDWGRQMAATACRTLNAGLIADCMDIEMTPEGIVGVCPAWGGEIMTRITFSDPERTGFATVQHHRLSAVEAAGNPGQVKRLATGDHPEPAGLRLISRTREPVEHRKLEQAEVVAVGGAGLGDMEGFSQLRDFAAAVGAEVGATRPPVLQHWVEEERLIGQTGKTVRPKLLFSVGTSGAIQYVAGIMETSTIVAINRDPDAPIFEVADIGIVADAKTFLPLLTARAKQTLMRGLADTLWEDIRADAQNGGGFGRKIRKLREAQGWSTAFLAESTGQTPEFIEQVERDAISPPVSFLVRLAGSLGIDPSTFLHREEQTIIRDQRVRSFMKRTQDYSYETLTPGAEKCHLRGFMVTIESQHAHRPVEYKHEGEEFIYVMEGDLEFTLGGKVQVLKPGECIRFNSDIPHKLKSLSKAKTRCLVILYTV
ncbi:MAG: FAD-binding protein [Desulfatiglandaceae bacterium]